MKKFVLSVFAAAIVAQIWGMVSWMALPWHMLDFKQFNNESNMSTAFRSELAGSGLYTIPNMDPKVHEDEAAMAEWDKKAGIGPFAFVSVRAEGIEPGMAIPMSLGFLLNIVVAAVLYWLVSFCTLRGFMQQALFIATAAAVGAMYTHMANWNWWYFPIAYCVVGFIDFFIAWFLAGFAMVKTASWLDGSD